MHCRENTVTVKTFVPALQAVGERWPQCSCRPLLRDIREIRQEDWDHCRAQPTHRMVGVISLARSLACSLHFHKFNLNINPQESYLLRNSALTFLHGTLSCVDVICGFRRLCLVRVLQRSIGGCHLRRVKGL